ncbi:Tetratricopeptide repeat-containing protein [Goodfellowiella coeruleoviolacea]|uniref:Tetratricopeptide repeat-containing protein n=2 Tax=Goodfellowiella coeruleoviolacea TaxID=334858 RepID=A0AAE3GLX1_9PSEU|nr:Tetratricopeptide repeat-containing protein [Goodfellowiella coeruleoviolacea]
MTLTTNDLLRDYVRDAQERETAEIEDVFVEIRDNYEALLRDDPDDVASAVGLAVLTGAKLQAYVLVDLGLEWHSEWEPAPALSTEDTVGQALAEDAVSAARRALCLDPEDNLAILLLGLALEHRGDLDAAVVAYARAAELDPEDTDATTRLAALRGSAPAVAEFDAAKSGVAKSGVAESGVAESGVTESGESGQEEVSQDAAAVLCSA